MNMGCHKTNLSFLSSSLDTYIDCFVIETGNLGHLSQRLPVCTPSPGYTCVSAVVCTTMLSVYVDVGDQTQVLVLAKQTLY